MGKRVLCETCKNNFINKRLRYKYDKDRNLYFGWLNNYYSENVKKPKDLNELIIDEEFCVYTHNYEEAIECSFYGRSIKITELYEKPKIVDDSYDGYQDINRTYTTGERQLATRMDCRSVA